MNRRSLSLAVPLAATVLLAACGGGASTAPGGNAATMAPASMPAATDAGSGGNGSQGGETGTTVTCAVLLPADEVQSILGVAPEPVTERTFPGSTECKWSYAADGTAVQDFFQVILDTNAADVAIWDGLRSSEADSDAATPTSIDGIGDEGHTWVGQGDYRKLYVRRGNQTLILRFDANLPALFSESQLIDLADRLFGRA
jgi:hypothetical protein